MHLSEITITRGSKKKTLSSRSKSREFTVTLLGYVCADSLWQLGAGGQAQRPVWIAYLGPDQASRAFTANFRCGRTARSGSCDLEIPKSSPHRWNHDRHGETTLTVAYLPEAFHLEPALAGDEISFLFMPPSWWLDEQARALRGRYGEDARDVARAALFSAYLDRRSPLPIVQDFRFQLRLYRAALEEPWIRPPRPNSSFHEKGTTACGLELPIRCWVSHNAFEEFLIDQTNAYFAKEIRRGKNRLRPDRRLLPYPSGAPTQLRLAFQVA